MHIRASNVFGIAFLERAIPLDSSGEVVTVYAPNGTMKTSLALGFECYANGQQTKDRLDPHADSSFEVLNADGSRLRPDEVVVIKSMDDTLGVERFASSLLIDPALKAQYDELIVDIERDRDSLLKAVAKTAGTTTTKQRLEQVENEVITSLGGNDDNLFQTLTAISPKLEQPRDPVLEGIKYFDHLGPDVEKLLADDRFTGILSGYMETYRSVLLESEYFAFGDFDLSHVNRVAKTLDEQGFFKLQHAVQLRSKSSHRSLEINSLDEFRGVVEETVDKIKANPRLASYVDDLLNAFSEKSGLKSFKALIGARPDLIARLEDLSRLKADVLLDYLRIHRSEVDRYLATYAANQSALQYLERTAAASTAAWERVVDTFRARFEAPFDVTVENRAAIVLGSTTVPDLRFTYRTATTSVESSEEQLRQVLSNGEKKALYILGILFQIEERRLRQVPTLLVIDDLVESFDYRNKYAIVQYLSEILHAGTFRMLILTHNFDFYRTVSNRLVRDLPGGTDDRTLLVHRRQGKLSVGTASALLDPISGICQRVHLDPYALVASIPVVRNLIQMRWQSQDADYKMLTSLLHLKADSDSHTEDQLKAAYERVLPAKRRWTVAGQAVMDHIRRIAAETFDAADDPSIERKIALGICLRLLAERFMIHVLQDPAFVAGIAKNQTSQLLDRVKSKFGGPGFPDAPGNWRGTFRCIELIQLMTPDFLHLNAFMIEPLMDVGWHSMVEAHEKMKASLEAEGIRL